MLKSLQLALAAQGINPVLDLLVRHAIAIIERRHSPLNAGDLPFVHVEIRVERLGGEKRAAPPGALGELLQRLCLGRSCRVGVRQRLVAGMSEATCGIIRKETDPGYRFAHPGYACCLLKIHNVVFTTHALAQVVHIAYTRRCATMYTSEH